jgi:quercetin dioxygenase-like cupin family protein
MLKRRNKNMRKVIRISMLALALSVVFGGTVFATVANNGFHSTILSRGTISERVHADTHAVKLKTKGAVAVVTATATFEPLGSSGWHAHPGVVLVTVVSGSVVVYNEDCEATVQAAGSAFVESGGDAGLVRNESTTTPAVVNVTYIVPAGTPNTGLRIDKANPGCPKS